MGVVSENLTSELRAKWRIVGQEVEASKLINVINFTSLCRDRKEALGDRNEKRLALTFVQGSTSEDDSLNIESADAVIIPQFPSFQRRDHPSAGWSEGICPRG